MMTEEATRIFRQHTAGVGPCEDSGPAQTDGEEEEPGPDDPSTSQGVEIPNPELAAVVFFCLKQTTCPRNWCIRMVCNPWFERVSMMVILLNCVTLGMYQPCENIDCSSERCQILQWFDAFIYIFFALEMVVKMVALGIFGRKCYLGDTWNRLDFFIVMAGMVEYSLDLQNINLSAIRTVRVLRPLKAINRVPSMRILVNLLLDTLPMLGNVLLLCFFVFFIFGIIGVQLWAGLLRNRCYLEENFTESTGISLPSPYYHPDEDDETPFICSLLVDNGIMSCGDVPARREEGKECCMDKDDYLYLLSLGGQELLNNATASGGCVNWNRYYTECKTGNTNPHKGAINFDNIGYAWIVIFQVITLEGWVEIMYYVMDAHSFYNFIYFILLIIVGSFFMINLCLVVIATQFSETKQREHQLMQEQRALCLSSSTVASFAEPGDCYEEIFQYVCHILRKAKRRTVGLYTTLRGGAKGTQQKGSHRRWRGQAKVGVNGNEKQSHTSQTLCPRHRRLDHTAQAIVAPIAMSMNCDPDNCPQCIALQAMVEVDTENDEGEGEAEAEGDGLDQVQGKNEKETALEDSDGQNPSSREWSGSGMSPTPEDGAEKKEGCWHCKQLWDDMRAKLWGIVESKYFNRGIMIAILINTISMGIEHHEQPEELTNVLEISNIVFTSMFALEMILKLTAFGFFNYLRNPYNIFDGIIVIISVCEIIGQSDGGLSVLRTFRLLRVLKLVRFMPALRRQLVVLMKTMDNVATFCMLLMLFIFIFSILGMHIFGCKFSLKTDAGDTVPDRKNFDSLLWAIVTVFQILTQEDWNMVLYNGMASTSPWAALYFVALMTFGNYVLFNLLVAILVEGFQAEGDANRSYSDDDRSSSNDESEKSKDPLYQSDPKICTLTPNGHLDPCQPGIMTSAKGSLQSDHIHFPLDSRKSSIISLGKANLEQRSVCSGRSSHYQHWGCHPSTLSSTWSTRRSSWNSLGRVSGSIRARVHSEQESLLSGTTSDRHSHHNPGPHQASVVPRRVSNPCPHRDRRALSLELPELLQVPRMGAPTTAMSRKKSCSGGAGLSGPSTHQDCNGKTPPPTQLLGEVFPQLNTRKEREEYEEEIDYSLCFRIQKMMEVYKPDWCEARDDWSVYLFSPQNRFRMLCQTVIAHKLFDYVVLAFIFLNCITVALERPEIDQRSLERLFLTISNYIFTAIFVAEMTLKVVSMGLYFGEQAYLRSSWNILDGFLVFVSLIDIVVSMASAGGAKILGVLRVLRLLRTLRPLRVISRAPGLKLVVETLISSLKPIGNIVLICCAFFIIFGILGVQLFKGKFFYCLGPDVKNITNRSDCLAARYKWVHHKYNFDNLGQALMSLFVLASKDGWVNIMYNGLDAVGIDQQPITNHNPWMLLYFISFLLIVSFFVLNMFVGVVVENFHKCRQHQEAEEAKRREEKRLRRLEKKRRKAQRLPYYASYSPVRLFIHSLCTSHYLDLFITFIICINVVTMSLEHYSQPKSLEIGLKYCNYFFTTTFVLEAMLKLVAFGFRRFFKDRWNQLDLAIVLLSVMGITLEEIEINAALPINPTIIRIMRVLRIARVLKLLKMATGMRALLDTVVQALPQVGNLGLLFMLLFFIYAALGVELFGKLICNEDYPCEGMSRHATFENFGMAFLTLFQVSTGDNWNGIMKDTLRDCTSDERSCLSNLQFISPLYFVSFVLTAQFVLINVVVAVLMKHLDDSNKEAQEDAELDAEIELELAQGGLCCLGSGGSGGATDTGGGPSSSKQGGRGSSSSEHDTDPRRQYSPAQENLWLDSVSLLIKDSFDGELLMIDNLSGSVFHHYSSPPVCKDCHHHQQEIRLAEVEQVSLLSEQLSDKSSSLALPDDLSLDDHSFYQLLVRDGKEERSSSDSRSSEELGGSQVGGPNSLPQSPAEDDCLFDLGTQSSQLPPQPPDSTSTVTGGSSSGGPSLLHLPADFFHPAMAALPPSSPTGGQSSANSASWALLRSPSANSRPLDAQHTTLSSSSLATGSSEGSLQTTLEEGLSFSVSPPRDLDVPLLCPLPADNLQGRHQANLHCHQSNVRVGGPSGVFKLQTSRGHQRSRSSGGSTSPSCTRQDSMEPSDEELGTGGNVSLATTANSEHLSETLSSLSLTSLLSPASLAPPMVKKCNSTGSLDQTNLPLKGNRDGRLFYTMEAQGYLSGPSWGADEELENCTNVAERHNILGRGNKSQSAQDPASKPLFTEYRSRKNALVASKQNR
ncbi:voltage-dependent T-type calcium channel subunit alpha-1I isoform X1 [Erpetoichthys calabaricus]|uniref:voltage-dependent T-type calcium channel subunit alpha-1I isoform X1 n=1 Tax=Erpetoichthys calabaricus TaxID=27687 RepID=UPI002234A6EE|nr:voltage-dependent T-type calcium channel subunit alpha-1I isoform X1 [Erpetoichthys calabaricus]